MDITYWAEFPFLDESEARLEEIGVSLQEIAETNGHPVRVAAVNRVQSSIYDGEVESNKFDSERLAGYDLTKDEVKLVSYPLARVLVSIINDPIVTKRYVDGEAKASVNLLREKLTQFRDKHSIEDIYGGHLTGESPIMEFLNRFGVGDGVTELGMRDDVGEGFRNYAYEVRVIDYLQMADGADTKSLREIGVDRGSVIISEATLFDILKEAIRLEVGERLPLPIPDGLMQAMSDEAEEIQSLVRSIDRVKTREFTEMDTSSIPKYIMAIINKSRDGGLNKPLEPMERYAAVLFLSNIGASPDEVVEILEPGTTDEEKEYAEDVVRKQARNLGGESGSALIPAPSYDVIDVFDGEPGEHYAVPDVGDYETPLQAYAEMVADDGGSEGDSA